jgi:hypothetical protein
LTDLLAVVFSFLEKEITMGYMQPRVFVADVYYVETECGTEIVEASIVGDNPSHDDFLQYIQGETIEEVELQKNKVLGHTTAPGYLDQTDLSVFDTEAEAWEYLVEEYPGVFTWHVDTTADPETENPLAWVYAPDETAALALRCAIQSIDGGRIEQDGSFLYAPIMSYKDAMEELEAAGFEVREEV